jgi:hypothetical protein
MGAGAVKHLYRRYVHSPFKACKRNNLYFCRDLVRFWYGWAAGKTMAGAASRAKRFCPELRSLGSPLAHIGTRAPEG